jgi:hypothetical protein
MSSCKSRVTSGRVTRIVVKPDTRECKHASEWKHSNNLQEATNALLNQLVVGGVEEENTESREQRAESREQRAKSRYQRAESKEQRAESRKQRSRGQNAERERCYKRRPMLF